jgi:hypothetical protein
MSAPVTLVTFRHSESRVFALLDTGQEKGDQASATSNQGARATV